MFAPQKALGTSSPKWACPGTDFSRYGTIATRPTSISVTIYGYQTRYQPRSAKSSCSSRHKTRVWEDFREGGSLVSSLSPHDCG